MSHEIEPNPKRNTSRYFVERRQVAWAVLLGTLLWGVFSYRSMPQRKDPEIPSRLTVAIARWPGMPAERVEQLVTKKVEERIAQNAQVTEVRSITKPGVAYVYAEISEDTPNASQELDDISQKLAGLSLPEGVQPVEYVRDFGDTATLMLTVSSPRVDSAELEMRSRLIEVAMKPGRTAVIWPHAMTLDAPSLRDTTQRLGEWLQAAGMVNDVKVLQGAGFSGFDAVAKTDERKLMAEVRRLMDERLSRSELHPDVWAPVAITEPGQVRAALEKVAGPKYSYRELDRYSERLEKALKTLPVVGRATRSGLLPEQLQLVFSQERWGAYSLPPDAIRQALSERPVNTPGAAVTAGGRALSVVARSDYADTAAVGDVLVRANAAAPAVPLRDLVQIERGYESPAQFLNYYQWRDSKGEWRRTRAITLDVQMRSGEQIARFSEQVDAELEKVKQLLPPDLILARTSDQPLQVAENVHLFMGSLWEAIGLVVLVSWIGFWEWRSALVMALAIPITLAMTFGMIHLLGVDIQQVSIAALIIALGLLVDDPVVAGDAIKRELGAGRPRMLAAWQGPTKLARAILFATVTNIVAYLPFLLLKGDNRRFLFTLPVVMTCALIASRVVSMTMVPMLGYYLLRDRRESTLEERRKKGFGAWYYRFGGWAIDHRWWVMGAAALLLVVGGWAGAGLKQQFFPFERQYLSFVDVWMPEHASTEATAHTAEQAEAILRRVADGQAGEPMLKSLTTWVGGGGPRYWLSSDPQPQLSNYAHILIQVRDKHDTERLIPLWQRALDAELPGATIDVRRLETSAPVGVPVQFRLSGDDLPALRREAEKMAELLRATPLAARVRNDWGEDTVQLDLAVDHDRARLAGVTELDIARAAGGLEGSVVGGLRDGDRVIPIVTRLRAEQRMQANDLGNLYVYSSRDGSRVPLAQVAKLEPRLAPARIARYQQFRTLNVQCFPADGHLPSEVVDAVMPQVLDLQKQLPAGIRMEIAGEYKESNKGNAQLSVVMLVSVLAIYFALVIQFRHAVKPLIVFAAIPFGIVGALIGLAVMGAPFGFMAFLGVASLVGVIVSHIVVLFDFIEERHEMGEPLREALLDAGILRLRPVLITVAATVTALVPLARNGGPLWEPLCYVQIGGLMLSTMVTLVLVPVVYAIFVQDLRLVRWEKVEPVEEQTVSGVVPLPHHS